MNKQTIIWNQPLGKEECPYARRWVLNLGFASVRVHHWYRSDDKRAPHSHPWWFLALVLRGSYEDWSYPRTRQGAPDLNSKVVDRLGRGSIRYRPAHHIHSVSVPPGGCWTILVTGREKQLWGFWTRRKDGAVRFLRSSRYFRKHGHHPCDQP
jgi:hypothetical protein